MRTSDIPVCPFFVDSGCTDEEDGFVQYDAIDDVVVMFVIDNSSDDEIHEFYVHSVQRLPGADRIVFDIEGDNVAVRDDQEFTLHVYTHRVVL